MKHAFRRNLIRKREFFNGWLVVAVVECECGNEERQIRLRLPSYGMMYSLTYDAYIRGQRVLCYRGHSGFSIWPYFAPNTYFADREFTIDGSRCLSARPYSRVWFALRNRAWRLAWAELRGVLHG